jgi:hypothetical protein
MSKWSLTPTLSDSTAPAEVDPSEATEEALAFAAFVKARTSGGVLLGLELSAIESYVKWKLKGSPSA